MGDPIGDAAVLPIRVAQERDSVLTLRHEQQNEILRVIAAASELLVQQRLESYADLLKGCLDGLSVTCVRH
jgi:hypothetical protein